MTQCLSALSNFKQKESESSEAYYDRLNELIYKISRYGVVCTTLKFNITFILGLKKEWKNIYLMIKTQEKKEEEKKIEKNFKGDSSYICNYSNRKNHVVHDCMLRKQEEKRRK